MDEPTGLERVYTVVTYIASTAALGVLIYLFIVYRLTLYVFGFVVFFCILAVVIDFTVRRLTRFTWRDIPQHGMTGQNLWGKVKVWGPIGPHAERVEKPTIATPAIPTLAEMLAKNLLDGLSMYHGYQINQAKELVPIVGSFNDVRTFAILGKGGVGKTVRLFFLLIQCILANATIYLCDPHMTKAGSITNLLKPLSRWVRFAVTEPKGDIEGQIMATVAEFKDRMERRVHDQEDDRSPCVLVIDEFARMMYHEIYGEPVVDAVVSCANQYRDYNGYSVVVMHELVATGKGKKVTELVARLRRALHAVFIMRVDKEYARYFLDGKRLKQVERLKTGMAFFIDTDGGIHDEVYCPRGTVSDAFTVAKMLTAIEAPVEPLQLSPVHVSPVTTNLRLIDGPGENGESVVKEPLEPGESGESVGESGETRESDEHLVIQAFFKLWNRNDGHVTREAIKQELGWNNKKHHIVKQVCDKYNLAC